MFLRSRRAASRALALLLSSAVWTWVAETFARPRCTWLACLESDSMGQGSEPWRGFIGPRLRDLQEGYSWPGRTYAAVMSASYSGIAKGRCVVDSALLDLAIRIVLHAVIPKCTVRRLVIALHASMRRRAAVLRVKLFDAHARFTGRCILRIAA